MTVKRYKCLEDTYGDIECVLASDYDALAKRFSLEEEAHARLQSRCYDGWPTHTSVFDHVSVIAADRDRLAAELKSEREMHNLTRLAHVEADRDRLTAALKNEREEHNLTRLARDAKLCSECPRGHVEADRDRLREALEKIVAIAKVKTNSDTNARTIWAIEKFSNAALQPPSGDGSQSAKAGVESE